MRKFEWTRTFVWPVMLVIVLLAACAPLQFPTAAIPPTGGTPAPETSPEAGETPDATPGAEDEGDSNIPTTGETGEQIQPSDDLERFPESRPPDIPSLTISNEFVSAGQDMVVQGTGFEANSTVLIYAGRPDTGADRNPLASASADDEGSFTLHTVLPADLPPDAVTAGQLLIVAAAEDGRVLAQQVVQTGQAGEVGEETQQPDQPEDEMDLSQLGFDFEDTILPQLNQALNANYTMEDLNVTRLEARRWPNGCLGLGAEGEFCTQQIVPGYRIVVEVAGQVYEVRTNENGSQVRLNPEQ